MCYFSSSRNLSAVEQYNVTTWSVYYTDWFTVYTFLDYYSHVSFNGCTRSVCVWPDLIKRANYRVQIAIHRLIKQQNSYQLPHVHNVNTLRPRQNGRRFVDDTFKSIFLNENVRIWIKISVKFVPKGQIDNIPLLVQIMAWRRPGDKPLSEAIMVNLPTHIYMSLGLNELMGRSTKAAYNI